jgi:hypothetical protein
MLHEEYRGYTIAFSEIPHEHWSCREMQLNDTSLVRLRKKIDKLITQEAEVNPIPAYLREYSYVDTKRIVEVFKRSSKDGKVWVRWPTTDRNGKPRTERREVRFNQLHPITDETRAMIAKIDAINEQISELNQQIKALNEGLPEMPPLPADMPADTVVEV